jgi:hypothetical protein
MATDNEKAGSFSILLFLVQRIVLLLVSSGICASVKYGEINFTFRIADEKIVFSEPSIKLGIKAESI